MADGFALLRRQALAAGVPLTLHLDLTQECNLRCAHCYLAEPRRAGLALPRLLRLLEEARELQTLFLLLSGGEPLLRPDLLEIVAAAREQRFAVKLNTNAMLLTPQLADALAAQQPLQIGVSVYSSEPDVHDAITGCPGSLARTLAGIRLLRARQVRVQLKTMVMPANAGRWAGVVGLAGELGADLFLDSTIFPTNDGRVAHAATHRVDLGEKERVAEAQQRWSCRDASPQPPEDLSSVMGGRDVAAMPLCTAGRSAIYVHPDGTVRPCVFWPLPLGSVLDEPLAVLWERVRNSPAVQGARRGAMQQCTECALLARCGLCPGLQQQLQGDPLRRDPLLCERTLAWERARGRCQGPETQGALPGICPG